MDWSVIQKSRDLARDRFPRILKLPIVPDQFTLVLEAVDSTSRVLDVGANTRRLEEKLKAKVPNLYYRSLDVDRTLPHDYYDLQEVHETFNLITLMDVVEHLAVEEAFQLISGLYPLLDQGGLFFVSTPNVCHPNFFWRDCTHRTPFRYNELAGILYQAGFQNLAVFRVGRLDFKGRLTFLVFKPLLKMLDLDYATSIMIRAAK